MSIEAPVRVDLSQENPWDQIDDTHLTEEDKDFLRDQFTLERNEVLYFTHEELIELSRLIEESTHLENDAQASVTNRTDLINDFIENQNGLSLSDLLGEQNEQFNAVEEMAEQLLFGEVGAMEGLELADRPKRYLTSALSLSIIKQIQQHENPVSVLENPQLIIASMGTGLEALQELSRLTDNPPNGDTHPRISLQDNGEGNEICMNVLKGREFFNALLSGDLRQEDIRDRLHEANTEEDIEGVDVSELSSEVQTLIENIRSRISTEQDQGESDGDTGAEVRTLINKANDAENSEKKKTIMELLGELIKALGEALGFKIQDLTDTASGTEGTRAAPGDTPAPEQAETAEAEALKGLDELTDNQLGNIDATALKASLENSDTQAEVRQILEGLIPTKNLQETIEHLFTGENTRFSQFVLALRTHRFPALNNTAGDIIAIDQFKTVLEEYGRYRASEGVAGITEGRTTWQEYAEARQTADWETDAS